MKNYILQVYLLISQEIQIFFQLLQNMKNQSSASHRFPALPPPLWSRIQHGMRTILETHKLKKIYKKSWHSRMFRDCLGRRVHCLGTFRAKMRESRSPLDIFLALRTIGNMVSTDDLITYIVRAYLYSPPDEKEMRRLSEMQQSSVGRGDGIEYATLTAFLGANEALICLEKSYAEIRTLVGRLRDASVQIEHAYFTSSKRTQSCPNFTSFRTSN